MKERSTEFLPIESDKEREEISEKKPTSTTPWPIELGQHPLGERKKRRREKDGIGELETWNKLPEAERIEGKSRIEVARECFDASERWRNLILETISVEPKERFEGGSIFYMWMNKVCPVSCEFCFFRSPTKDKRTVETEITPEGIEKIIQFTKEGKILKMVVSGGGEPLMSKDKINSLARSVKVKDFVVVTSAYWAKGKNGAERTLDALRESTQENPHHSTTTVRVSLDEGHFSRLSNSGSFDYVKNIVEWFSKNGMSGSRMKLLFHTMEGDTTVDGLLAQLSVKSSKETRQGMMHKKEVELENGLTFTIEYTQLFDASALTNLHDRKQVAKNVQTFDDFIDERRKGNMPVHFNGEQENGLDFLTFYDGTSTIWGASAPEVETSIYTEGYKQIIEKNLADVLTLGELEKGTKAIQAIVAEVNPKAVERAVCSGLRDFYARLLFEEDATRLYVSIRLLQDFVAEGRITEDQQTVWPKQLRKMVETPKEELQEAYFSSSHSIVKQYLTDPTVTADKLVSLHTRVLLGHYAMTSEKMMKEIDESDIDPAMKQTFRDAVVAPHSQMELV